MTDKLVVPVERNADGCLRLAREFDRGDGVDAELPFEPNPPPTWSAITRTLSRSSLYRFAISSIR